MLLVAITVSAQDRVARSTFSFGPVVSYGHSWISSYGNSVFMPSMSVGVFGIYSPHEHWGLGADLRYSQEGSKVDNPEGGETETRINYVRVPLRLMWFGNHIEDRFRPKVTFGPSFGFKAKYDGPSSVYADKFDFGFNGTAGFNYRLANATWLNFDIGYYQGVKDVAPQSTKKELNGNASINLGIGFDI